MDESRLTDIGKAFLTLVEARWPAFLGFASLSEYDELTIEYPSPFSARGAVLTIQVDVHTDEVIVGFGGGHVHCGAWRAPTDADHRFLTSAKLIAGILDESVVGCVLTRGGALVWRDTLEQEPFWADVESVRSWRGTHDLDFG